MFLTSANFSASKSAGLHAIALVTHVHPLDNFHLELSFSTGEKGIFDAHPYLDKGVFVRLRDITLFKQAYVAFDTVCWPGGLDISPETLYDRSTMMAQNG